MSIPPVRKLIAHTIILFPLNPSPNGSCNERHVWRVALDMYQAQRRIGAAPHAVWGSSVSIVSDSGLDDQDSISNRGGGFFF
jgi:hypothetical protein